MGLKRSGGFEQVRKLMKATVQFVLQIFYSFEKNFSSFSFNVTELSLYHLYL